MRARTAPFAVCIHTINYMKLFLCMFWTLILAGIQRPKKTTTKTTFANVSSSLFGSLIDRVNFLQSFSIWIVHEYRFVHGPSHFGSLWTLSPLMCLLKKNQFSNQNSLLVYALRLLTIILILWFVVVVGAAAVLSPSRSLSQFSFLVYNFQMENWQSCDFIIVNITVFTVAGCLHFRSAQLLRWNRKFSTTISTPQHLNLYRCICTYKTFIQKVNEETKLSWKFERQVEKMAWK